MNDSFYRDFEDRFRGSRELILWRLSVYLPFIRPLTADGLATRRAVDLGCGRGEWLELLSENGFDASGVDLDMGMLSACHERGLTASQADALSTLQALPDDSIGLISAFHLVEHLPFDMVRALVRESLRVLVPGGLLILETPNPDNLTVGACSFFLDPSHLRPLPSGLLGFVVEHAGFARNKILRIQEAAELRGETPIGLDEVLCGVSPDYAVVAQKHALLEVLEQFDTPFDSDFGVTLSMLAQRYEQQMRSRTASWERWQMEAERRAGDINDRVTQVSDRVTQVSDRVTQVSDRVTQVEARFEELLQSRSWRITAPLRWLTELVRRFGRRFFAVFKGAK